MCHNRLNDPLIIYNALSLSVNEKLEKNLNNNQKSKKELIMYHYPANTYFMLWMTKNDEGQEIDHWEPCHVLTPQSLGFANVATDYADAIEYAKTKNIENFYLVRLAGIMTHKMENSLKKS